MGQLAESVKDLSTLVAALKAANLTADVLKRLLEPSHIKELDAVLEYHVIAGAAVHAADLKPEQRVKTLEGEEVLIEVYEKNVYINRRAKVTTADVDATNGVVHIIDGVLIPQ